MPEWNFDVIVEWRWSAIVWKYWVVWKFFDGMGGLNSAHPSAMPGVRRNSLHSQLNCRKI